MKEKIASYLKNAGGPVPARQILQEVLNIISPNSFAADKVLRAILESDPRFRERNGLWHLAVPAAPVPPEFTSLYLQWNNRHPEFYRGAVDLRGPKGEPATSPFSSELWEPSAYKALLKIRLLIVWNEGAFRQWKQVLRTRGLPAPDLEILAIRSLSARVLQHIPPIRQPEDLAPLLGLPPPDTENMSSMARFLSACFLSLLARVPEDRRFSPEDLRHWIAEGKPKIDFTKFAFDRDFLGRIPESPGVYIMRDRAGEVIYIGKSHNLKRRVGSYFTSRALLDPKVVRIHNQLHTVEIVGCDNEVEALLLEMQMIRDFQPAINLQTEVHEQAGRYGRNASLLLLVPAGKWVSIYFLREGEFVERVAAPLGRAPSKKLRSLVRRVFFGKRLPGRPPKEAWEIEIVARWLSAHRRRLNFIDVADAGGSDHLVRQLELYLKDPDRLAFKVHYR